MLEARIRAQRAQKRLLEGVVGGVPPEHPPQLGQDGALLLLVEALERREVHGFHHLFKRGFRTQM